MHKFTQQAETLGRGALILVIPLVHIWRTDAPFSRDRRFSTTGHRNAPRLPPLKHRTDRSTKFSERIAVGKTKIPLTKVSGIFVI